MPIRKRFEQWDARKLCTIKNVKISSLLKGIETKICVNSLRALMSTKKPQDRNRKQNLLLTIHELCQRILSTYSKPPMSTMIPSGKLSHQRAPASKFCILIIVTSYYAISNFICGQNEWLNCTCTHQN